MSDNKKIEKIIYKIANKKTVKKVIIKLGKKDYLKWFTKNIGKIVEEEDRFVCYVNPKKIKKKDKYGYIDFYLKAFFNSNCEEDQRMYKLLGVNKPIYYIIDGIKFKNFVTLYSVGESYVIFKNCEFYEGIKLDIANSVTFEENKYYNHYSAYYGDLKTFFNCSESKRVNELRFINDNFFNSDIDHHPCRFGMDIKADRLELINSNIVIDNTVKYGEKEIGSDNGSVEIEADEILIVDSAIEAPMVCLKCDKFDINEESIIKSKNMVMIDNKSNQTKPININTPCFVYNDVEFNNIATSVSNEDIEKKEAITALLTKLKDFSKEVEAYNKEQVQNLKIKQENDHFLNELKTTLQQKEKTNQKEIDTLRNELETKPLKRVLNK